MRLTLRERLVTGVLLWCAAAGMADAQSHRPAVVELFTSEGCSSCPPAESYIGELAQRRDVLALAYHVDYWDDLGWRDRFALARATERQSLYAQTLRRPSVYTPQIVVDGRADYVGSDREAVGRALRGATGGVPIAISMRDADVVISVGSAQAGTAEVILVPYLRQAVSAIGRGENAGRTLQEFNIVRAFRTLGRWSGEPQTFRAPLSSLPADATDVAVLVQSLGQGPIIGAASTVVHATQHVATAP